MKIIFILSLFFSAYSTKVFSQDICVDDIFTQMAKGITYPNCHSAERINSFMIDDKNSFCNECKDSFERLYGKPILSNSKNLQEDFFNSALEDYKKNISNNLLNTVKLRSLLNTKSSFEKSSKSCKMRSASDFAKNCNSPSAKRLLSDSKFFQNLSKELSNDLAKFLSTDKNFNPERTMLKRNEQPCFIPEKDILAFSNSAYIEAVPPKLITFFKEADLTKYKSIPDLFESDEVYDIVGEDGTNLYQSLLNHPLLATHFKSPSTLGHFFKKIPAPASAATLTETLYSKENGDDYDNELATSCEKAFNSLKGAICSDDFEAGKIFNNPKKNYKKLKISQIEPSEIELASSPTLFENNIRLLELCENKSASDKLDLTKVNREIGTSLTPQQINQSFEEYRTEKYNTEIGSLNTLLCEMTEETCIEGTLTCSIYKKYKKSKEANTLENKLANSSNSEFNSLLRSMIGDTKNIEPKTKEILIAQGILPKSDGTLVPQPDVPERRPEVFAMAQAKLPPSPRITKFDKPGSATASRTPTNNSQYDYSATPASTSSARIDLPEISDLMRGSNDELKSIQDEIKRRLSGLPNNRPANVSEAKKIARESFKANNKDITPYQETAFADRLMNPASQVLQAPTPVSAMAPASAANRAAVSESESAQVKLQKAQMNEALAGMAGAQQLNKQAVIAASSENKPKELTKVALNIAEDPRVTLSDIFNDKYVRNDSETQLLKVLLRSKNNFLLQLKSMNFKITFDGNKFNVLLESGDKKEAERIRPQLELFLKKLKS